MFDDGQHGEDGAIVEGFIIMIFEVEICRGMIFAAKFWEVWHIGVDGKDHVACFVADTGIGMYGNIVN